MKPHDSSPVCLDLICGPGQISLLHIWKSYSSSVGMQTSWGHLGGLSVDLIVSVRVEFCSVALTVSLSLLLLRLSPSRPVSMAQPQPLTSKQTVTVPRLQAHYCNLGEVEQRLGSDAVLLLSRLTEINQSSNIPPKQLQKEEKMLKQVTSHQTSVTATICRARV